MRPERTGVGQDKKIRANRSRQKNPRRSRGPIWPWSGPVRMDWRPDAQQERTSAITVERERGPIVSVGVDPTGTFWPRLTTFDVHDQITIATRRQTSICPSCESPITLTLAFEKSPLFPHLWAQHGQQCNVTKSRTGLAWFKSCSLTLFYPDHFVQRSTNLLFLLFFFLRNERSVKATSSGPELVW